MVPYWTAAWLDRYAELCAELPKVPGATGSVQVVVNGAPDGGGEFHVSFLDGRVSEHGTGADDSADVTLTVPYALALELLGGTVDANVAYMRGDLKTTGNSGRLIPLLHLAQTDAHRSLLATLNAETER